MLSRVYYQRPDRLHVENFSPVKRHIVSDGTVFRSYTEGAPQGFSRPVAELNEEMLRNLLDNAVRYSPVGSEVTVLLVSDTGEPALTVQDEGPGVPPEELPRLMERFYRGTAVTAEGSGLGLTIVGRIAELHGAVLELANRPSGGFEARLRWRG